MCHIINITVVFCAITVLTPATYEITIFIQLTWATFTLKNLLTSHAIVNQWSAFDRVREVVIKWILGSTILKLLKIMLALIGVFDFHTTFDSTAYVCLPIVKKQVHLVFDCLCIFYLLRKGNRFEVEYCIFRLWGDWTESFVCGNATVVLLHALL